MKEVIKFKEVKNEEYSVDFKNKIKIKPYFSIEELTEIIGDINSKSEDENGVEVDRTAFGRSVVKVVRTAKYCTNIDFSDKSVTQIYNICAEQGLLKAFEDEIFQYYEIDKLIKKDESVYDLVESFTKNLESMIKGFDIKDMLGAISKASEVSNGNKK